jgi:hypothetical protein
MPSLGIEVLRRMSVKTFSAQTAARQERQRCRAVWAAGKPAGDKQTIDYV